MSGTDKSQFASPDAAEASAVAEAPPLPVVILVDPQLGENIGTAARAMLNCGLSDLRIVRPRDGWPNEKAVSASSGALERMPPVEIFDTLPAALTDLHYVYATTARPREMVKPVFTPRAAAQDIRGKQAQGLKIGILFGAERMGLTSDDVAQAHAIITAPLNPGFSSLNLAQGVLLVAHEWWSAQAAGDGADSPAGSLLPIGDSRPATHKEFEDMLTRLESELDTHHFFRNPDMRPTMLRNIRSLFTRAQPTEQEIRTFHGIITALTGGKGPVRDKG